MCRGGAKHRQVPGDPSRVPGSKILRKRRLCAQKPVFWRTELTITLNWRLDHLVPSRPGTVEAISPAIIQGRIEDMVLHLRHNLQWYRPEN
ncbi:uncharacterized protein B0T23DRAFT_372027 [Neurospora hispaniola]|uniref:Uncharacterized protein n=1 Tax=Neurospora hispaniola TaxID=588809 RepID=A0AAJ0MW20_9PEZI|nr:hypothetical protein B0T23DRAFT_372027 [Neurospora hispaniola]